MGGRRREAWSSCAENGPRVRARLRTTRTHQPLERDPRSNPRRAGWRNVFAGVRTWSSRADNEAGTSHPCSVTFPRARRRADADRNAPPVDTRVSAVARPGADSGPHLRTRGPPGGRGFPSGPRPGSWLRDAGPPRTTRGSELSKSKRSAQDLPVGCGAHVPRASS
jgi:hypothetical protein